MKVQKIIVHHSATPDGKVYTWDEIRKYHISRGWNDIGYHFGIVELCGYVTVVHGRMAREVGAHTIGWNAKSLGVCVVGNFDDVEPSIAQYQRCADLCAWLCWAYRLSPETDIVPHSMYADKTCPGRRFDMNRLVGYAADIYRGWYRTHT